MTTPLFLLRCVQIGLSISELDLLTIGTVNDMYAEMSNDDFNYPAHRDTGADGSILTGRRSSHG